MFEEGMAEQIVADLFGVGINEDEIETFIDPLYDEMDE